MRNFGLGTAILATALLAVIGCFALTGCVSLSGTNGSVSYDPGSGVITGSVGVVFKGTDDDILKIAQANAQTFAKTGTLKLPKGCKDRAVCFGNNYPGTTAELHMCVSDAANDAINLVRYDHFDPHGICLFINEGCTKENYQSASKWAKDAKKDNGRWAFFNSSHGAQDTNAEGKIVNILVTDDMVRTGRWDATTEIQPDFWHDLFSGDTAPFCGLNDSCHAGGQMRASDDPAAPFPAVKALQGPPHVQARVNVAMRDRKGIHEPDATKITNGTIFHACLPGQLSSETSKGGAATVAFWAARKALGTNLSVKEIIRNANALMKADGMTQNMNPVGSVNLIWHP